MTNDEINKPSLKEKLYQETLDELMECKNCKHEIQHILHLGDSSYLHQNGYAGTSSKEEGIIECEISLDKNCHQCRSIGKVCVKPEPYTLQISSHKAFKQKKGIE